jgi:hypothetical protein
MTGFLVFIISKSSADKKVYFWMDFFNKLSSLSLIGFSLFLIIEKSSMSRLETSSNYSRDNTKQTIEQNDTIRARVNIKL